MSYVVHGDGYLRENCDYLSNEEQVDGLVLMNVACYPVEMCQHQNDGDHDLI